MEIHNDGTLYLGSDKPIDQEKVERIMRDVFGEDAVGSFGDTDGKILLVPNSPEWELAIEDVFGSQFDDDVRKFAKRLKRIGVRLHGDYKYWGDYDGFVKVDWASVESHDIEFYQLMCGEDQWLVDELEKRGYKVTKVAKAKNSKNKKEKKEKKQ